MGVGIPSPYLVQHLTKEKAMKIELEPDKLRKGDLVAKGRTEYVIVDKLPLGAGWEFLLRGPKGRTRWVTCQELEVHYRRTGNTVYTPVKRGGRK